VTVISEGGRTVEKVAAARRGPDRSSERGTALVEFALILPVFMSLVLGLITGGAAYNRKLSMTSSVREGSRFAATLNGPTTNGWAADVTSRTVELSGGDLTSSQVCVELLKVGTGDVYSSLPASCSGSGPGTPTTAATGDCVVKVWAARPDKLQAMFFSATLTLTAKSVSRYESKVSGSCT
jgi:Flp pilus assembly protein TadG